MISERLEHAGDNQPRAVLAHARSEKLTGADHLGDRSLYSSALADLCLIGSVPACRINDQFVPAVLNAMQGGLSGHLVRNL